MTGFLLKLELLLGVLLSSLLAPFAVSVSASNLSFVVSAPAVNEAIFCARNRMVLAAGHLDHVISLVGIEVLDSGRSRAVEFVADTQLPVVVQAPGEELVLVIYVE